MVRILVIDDDEYIRMACSRVLSRAGWLVVCAESGDEGLRELRSGAQKIDVVLVDRLMPGLSGMEVLAEIHAADAELPVIIMSGSATDDSAIETRRRGAYDCLAKPFTPDELRGVIKRAVAKGREQS